MGYVWATRQAEMPLPGLWRCGDETGPASDQPGGGRPGRQRGQDSLLGGKGPGPGGGPGSGPGAVPAGISAPGPGPEPGFRPPLMGDSGKVGPGSGRRTAGLDRPGRGELPRTGQGPVQFRGPDQPGRDRPRVPQDPAAHLRRVRRGPLFPARGKATSSWNWTASNWA